MIIMYSNNLHYIFSFMGFNQFNLIKTSHLSFPNFRDLPEKKSWFRSWNNPFTKIGKSH